MNLSINPNHQPVKNKGILNIALVSFFHFFLAILRFGHNNINVLKNKFFKGGVERPRPLNKKDNKKY